MDDLHLIKHKKFIAILDMLPSAKLNDVKSWLLQQLTYTLHKPVSKSFPTQPMVVYEADELW